MLSVKESMRGVADDVIPARAMVEGRIVVSFDKDFGELAFRSHLPAACGVVLFRIAQRGRDEDSRRVVDTLVGREDWGGAFWTITDQRIRHRPLPRAGE